MIHFQIDIIREPKMVYSCITPH